MIFRNDTDKDAAARDEELRSEDGQVIDGDVVDGYDDDTRPEARDEDPTTADTVVTDPDATVVTDPDATTYVDPDARTDDEDDDDREDAAFDGPDAASTFDHAADDEDDRDDGIVATNEDTVLDENDEETNADGYGTATHADPDTADGDRDGELSTADVAEPGVGTPAFDSDGYDPATADAVAVGTAPVDTQQVDGTQSVDGTYDNEPVAGIPADDVANADESPVDTPAELVPGAVTNDPGPGGWSDDDGQAYRDRWRDVQLRFVDDPRGAAAEAGSLVGEAVDAFTAQLARQRQELDSWQSSEGDDTEIFRVAVRRYRDLLDKVLGS